MLQLSSCSGRLTPMWTKGRAFTFAAQSDRSGSWKGRKKLNCCEFTVQQIEIHMYCSILSKVSEHKVLPALLGLWVRTL